MRGARSVCIGGLLLGIAAGGGSGCGTIAGLRHPYRDVYVFAGVRHNLCRWNEQLFYSLLVPVDLPFSAVLDVALLPVTLAIQAAGTLERALNGVQTLRGGEGLKRLETSPDGRFAMMSSRGGEPVFWVVDRRSGKTRRLPTLSLADERARPERAELWGVGHAINDSSDFRTSEARVYTVGETGVGLRRIAWDAATPWVTSDQGTPDRVVAAASGRRAAVTLSLENSIRVYTLDGLDEPRIAVGRLIADLRMADLPEPRDPKVGPLMPRVDYLRMGDDGSWLFAADAYGHARLWTIDDDDTVKLGLELGPAQVGSVYSFGLSPCGRYAATTSRGRSVRLLDLAASPVGEGVPVLPANGAPTSVAISHGGRLLAVGTHDKFPYGTFGLARGSVWLVRLDPDGEAPRAAPGVKLRERKAVPVSVALVGEERVLVSWTDGLVQNIRIPDPE